MNGWKKLWRAGLGYLLATAALPLAAAAAPAADDMLEPSGKPAVNCVDVQRIRNTDVRDDRTIDFYLRGGEILRNTLPYKCASLGFERAFAYKTSINQLCSVDTITVLRQGGAGIPGPTCGLGPFVPMKKKAVAPKPKPAG
jgi:hypothetical protein